MPKRRKKILYLDFHHVECGRHLNDLELLTREMLLSRNGWDCMAFWLDLEEALKTLTSIQRECFVLSFIEGYTAREIGVRRGSTHAAVVKHVQAAARKIRLFLRDGYQNP